jgi:hypothetical protein
MQLGTYGMWIRILLLLVLCNSVFAEFRIWENAEGKTVEAEFVTMSDDNVTLRNRDGKIFQAPILSLSMSDQEFLKTGISPVLDIDVDKRDKSIDHWKMTHYDISVKVKNAYGYKGNLTAIFIVVGKIKANGLYVILERTSSQWACTNGTSHLLKSQGVLFTQDSVMIDGYVVVVKNERGDIVNYESSNPAYTDHMNFFLTQEVDYLFTSRFSSMKRKHLAREYCDVISGKTSDQERWLKRVWDRKKEIWHDGRLRQSDQSLGAELNLNLREGFGRVLNQLLCTTEIPSKDFVIRASVHITSGHIGFFDANGKIGRMAIQLSNTGVDELEIQRVRGELTFYVNGKVIEHTTYNMKESQGDLLFGALIVSGKCEFKSVEIEIL